MGNSEIDDRCDDRNINVTSAMVQQAVGVPPAVRWRYEGTPRMLVESYLHMPTDQVTFSRMPMHMIGILLDGRALRHIGPATESSGASAHGQNFVNLPNRCTLVHKNTLSPFHHATGSYKFAAVYLAGPGQVAMEALFQGGQQPLVLNDGLLAAVTRQLLRLAVNRGQNPPGYAQSLVNALTSQLQWLALAQPPLHRRRSKLSDLALTQALRLIEEHLDEPLTIQWLSDSVRMLPSLFRRRFLGVTGMPVHRFILKHRLERARELIDDSDLALSVVAGSCGFSSQSHMTAAFKRELGVTPGELRRSHLKQA